MNNINTGRLFVIAAPSGGGKTSLVRALVKQLPNIKVSVSFTTRHMRPGEEEGVDYCFVSVEQFEHMIAENVFLEHAQVYGHYYGTSKQWVKDQLDAGMDIVLEIDWQGAEQIRKLFPEQTVTIFILPPSFAILKQRLRDRRQDPPAVIAMRLREAEQDVIHSSDFDYLLVNDIFDNALHQLITIIKAERQGKPQKNLPRHEHLVQALLSSFTVE